MKLILIWIEQNIPETIALILSGVSLVVTIILSRKEKPNIMPYGNSIQNSNHLSLDFLNTSLFNIHKLTILINGFDSEYNEINSIDFSDKYLFSIGEKTTFNYGFNLTGDLAKNIYFRVRFRGLYNTRFPFINRSVEQSLWYSIMPLNKSENGVTLKISNTHKEEIDKIKNKHAVALKNYETRIDSRYSK